jgi:hypothetical protein
MRRLCKDYLEVMAARDNSTKRKSFSRAPAQPGLAEETAVYVRAPRKSGKVRFGDVTVPAANLTAEQIEKNIAEGQAAMRRLAERIVRPGVSIRRRKGVPYYHVDADDPGVIIRTLDGVVERGVFADGAFKKTP